MSADAPPSDPARRELLTGITAGVAFGALLAGSPRIRAASAGADKLPMLKQSDPAAQATQYVTDAHRAKRAAQGASCANCALYGSVSPGAGTCSLFPNNQVVAGGWCSAWSSL